MAGKNPNTIARDNALFTNMKLYLPSFTTGGRQTSKR